jgi:hypothetical protein
MRCGLLALNQGGQILGINTDGTPHAYRRQLSGIDHPAHRAGRQGESGSGFVQG